MQERDPERPFRRRVVRGCADLLVVKPRPEFQRLAFLADELGRGGEALEIIGAEPRFCIGG